MGIERLGRFELNRIHVGDAMMLGIDVPSNSVDLIFADPVYKNMNHYGWLALFAQRVLRPGGSVIAQAGTLYRAQAETHMAQSAALTPQPLLVERFTGGHYKLWKTRSFVCYKPYLWFSKGKRTIGGWVPDMVQGGGKAKAVHKWGDSVNAAMVWIERLVPVGGIVVDPFAGSGMVLYACLVLQRNCVAFEIIPEVAAEAMQHLSAYQLSMFALEPEEVGYFEPHELGDYHETSRATSPPGAS